MAADGDDVQGYALGVVAAVVVSVVVGVVAIGVTGWPRSAPTSSLAVETGRQQVWFGADADSLTSQASETLAAVADAVRGNPLATIRITGVHAAHETPADAQRRAARVLHALASNGIAADRLSMGEAIVAAPGQSASHARRVELDVQ